MTPEAPALLIAPQGDGALLLRLNWPERRNALATARLQEIGAALAAAQNDEAMRTEMITGNDKVFAAVPISTN